MGKNFAWPVTVMAYDDYIALKECVQQNKSKFKTNLIIFGSGIRGTLFGVLLEELGILNYCYVDNNQQRWQGNINGHLIIEPKALKGNHIENTILISVERDTEIKKQLEEYGYIENEDYFSVRSNLYDKYIQELFREISLETLILGDCGLSQISIKDSKYENLGEMMLKAIGHTKTKVLAMHGMGMRAYYNILKIQLDIGMCPKQLLLMVNLEVFTGSHHLLPRTQHLDLFEQIVIKSKLEINYLNEYISEIEERINRFDLNDKLWTNNSESNSNLVLRMNYMYKFKHNSEDLTYLMRIIELCDEKNIKLKPFIPPVNYEYAVKCLGEQFTIKYNENVSALKTVINASGYDVIDLSYLLASELFADLNTIDETANYRGRKKMLEELLKEII